MPIGERDRRLLALRARLFGPVLHVYTTCPQCGQELEYCFNSETLAGSTTEDHCPECETATFELDGAQIRMLNTADQMELSRLSEEQAGQFILEHCVAVQDNLEKPALERVLEAMLKHDPLTEIMLRLQCEPCGYVWSQLLDIIRFFQIEVDDFAQTLLQQVHILARAYGWSEQQILGLSAQRRSAYLGMVMSWGDFSID
jgi:hypothetical protein